MNRFAYEIKWGAIFTACSILWMAFEKSMGWHDAFIEKQATYSMFFGLIAIAVYVLALLDKKKQHYAGSMNWTQGFLSGLVLTVVIAILTPLSLYAGLTSVSPEFLTNMKNLAISKGSMSPEAAETFYGMQGYIMSSVFFALSTGVVTSAVVALFVRSKTK